jgi:hypothetical protein
MTLLYRDKTRPAPSLCTESVSGSPTSDVVYFPAPPKHKQSQAPAKCGTRSLVDGPFEKRWDI